MARYVAMVTTVEYRRDGPSCRHCTARRRQAARADSENGAAASVDGTSTNVLKTTAVMWGAASPAENDARDHRAPAYEADAWGSGRSFRFPLACARRPPRESSPGGIALTKKPDGIPGECQERQNQKIRPDDEKKPNGRHEKRAGNPDQGSGYRRDGADLQVPQAMRHRSLLRSRAAGVTRDAGRLFEDGVQSGGGEKLRPIAQLRDLSRKYQQRAGSGARVGSDWHSWQSVDASSSSQLLPVCGLLLRLRLREPQLS